LRVRKIEKDASLGETTVRDWYNCGRAEGEKNLPSPPPNKGAEAIINKNCDLTGLRDLYGSENEIIELSLEHLLS